jgi:hypothetical protein
MYQINNTIAWILPPKTGVEFTMRTWDDAGVLENPELHNYTTRQTGRRQYEENEIRIENLASRTLVLNVRNPYERFLAFWRHVAKWQGGMYKPRPSFLPLQFMGSDDYAKIVATYNTPLNRLWTPHDDQCPYFYHNSMCYLLPITYLLERHNILISRVDILIKYETIETDLANLGIGLTPANVEPLTDDDGDIPKVPNTVDSSILYPTLSQQVIDAVNAHYADDFTNFGYTML